MKQSFLVSLGCSFNQDVFDVDYVLIHIMQEK